MLYLFRREAYYTESIYHHAPAYHPEKHSKELNSIILKSLLDNKLKQNKGLSYTFWFHSDIIKIHDNYLLWTDTQTTSCMQVICINIFDDFKAVNINFQRIYWKDCV